MSTYARHSQKAGETTPQSEGLPGQVPNSAGGYSFAVDHWTRALRFLILGAEGGSYYASERRLVRENATAIQQCLAEDPVRLAALIADVSTRGRALKQDPALFALGLMTATPGPSRQAALAVLPQVCRTASHLLQWAREHTALGPETAKSAWRRKGAKPPTPPGAAVMDRMVWSRSLRAAVANWFDGRTADEVARQVVKYPQRQGLSCLDLLRFSHAKGATARHANTYRWVRRTTEKTHWQGRERVAWTPIEEGRDYPTHLLGMEALKRAGSASTVADLVREYDLPREAVEAANTQWLTDAGVWRALLLDQGGRVRMPMTALIRTLNRLTAAGVLDDKGTEKAVCGALVNADLLKRARVHPLAVLIAQKVYASGRGQKGALTWKPRAQVIDALDEAFVLAHGAVEPTNKALCLAVDVSGSMSGGSVAGAPLTPREAAAALTLVWLRTEPDVETMAFATQFIHLPLSAKMRLDQAVALTDSLGMMGTDCALPMLWALKNKRRFDAFVVLTDSETWHGQVHPSVALQRYRDAMGIPARLVVVGMVSNGFTIADPTDAGMLDVVGFDGATPGLTNAFIRGEV